MLVAVVLTVPEIVVVVVVVVMKEVTVVVMLADYKQVRSESW